MIDTILVVDEYDTHRVGLANVLRKATGADVIAARNGRIALDEIRQQRWDVVVLDLDLPDMTGLQLIDALARNGGTGGIILTSAHPARLVQAAASYAQSRGISVLATLEKPLKSSRARRGRDAAGRTAHAAFRDACWQAASGHSPAIAR